MRLILNNKNDIYNSRILRPLYCLNDLVNISASYFNSIDLFNRIKSKDENILLTDYAKIFFKKRYKTFLKIFTEQELWIHTDNITAYMNKDNNINIVITIDQNNRTKTNEIAILRFYEFWLDKYFYTKILEWWIVQITTDINSILNNDYIKNLHIINISTTIDQQKKIVEIYNKLHSKINL